MSNLNKPVILILIDWFLPAYKAGGPVRSVANLIENLKNDFEFKIVTGDRDLGDTSPFKDVKTNSWIQKDDYQILKSEKHVKPCDVCELYKIFKCCTS